SGEGAVGRDGEQAVPRKIRAVATIASGTAGSDTYGLPPIRIRREHSVGRHSEPRTHDGAGRTRISGGAEPGVPGPARPGHRAAVRRDPPGPIEVRAQ